QFNPIEGTQEGRDTLTGTAGNDRITGLGGRDTIRTGAGSDIVAYTSVRDGMDTIKDFSVGLDKIDVSQIMDSQNLTLSFEETVAQGYLQFGSVSNGGYVQFDLDGNAGSNRGITLALVEGVSLDNLNQSQNFIL
ncbi:MAG: type I secretion C-terminal target domain-containing protein, partial [Synechococcales cyanobacterium RU_4_20]|nr:type I secretion C-terminal target domain-containing protein [Synechococcales cyanobacterium RU_4_20]